VLLHELAEHLPFSVSAVAIGLIVAGTICIVGIGERPPQVAGAPGAIEHVDPDHAHDSGEPHDTGEPRDTGDAHEAGDAHDAARAGDAGGVGPERDGDHARLHAHDPPRLFFHLFHPAHMLFSAAATTAMFCRYERKLLKAILVGLLGAIGVCGVSDIAIPHVAAIILGARPEAHICIIQHPGLVLPFAVVGVAIGLGSSRGVMRSTIISHSLHVFASTMASIFYMVGPLGTLAWIDDIGAVFFFVVLAVLLPCCTSDIVFPLLMIRPSREAYMREPHCH
jgi:hypothetical protein